jgi:hypothetical protein
MNSTTRIGELISISACTAAYWLGHPAERFRRNNGSGIGITGISTRDIRPESHTPTDAVRSHHSLQQLGYRATCPDRPRHDPPKIAVGTARFTTSRIAKLD